MRAGWLAAGLCAALATVAAHGETGVDFKLGARLDARAGNRDGALAASDGVDGAQTLESRWRVDASAGNRLRGVATARRERDGAPRARFSELALARALGPGHLSVGKQAGDWGVGHGFRPFEAARRDDPRALHPAAPEGAPTLAWETFDAQRAFTVMLVNPGRGRAARPVDDGALALRLYRRAGARDEYALLRGGARNGVEAGVGAARVLGEALELHGALLARQRHEKWLGADAAEAPAARDPGRWRRFGGGGKALIGMTWTSEARLSLLAEAWIERGAYDAGQWSAWRARNAALLARGRAAPALVAANLGWNAASLRAPELRQRNVLLRLARDEGEFDASAEALWMPEDDGVIATLGLTWKPGPWRLSLRWRRFGGAAASVARALPSRGAGVAAIERAF